LVDNFRLGTNEGGYFYGCSNLDIITPNNSPNLEQVSNLKNCFNGCLNLKNANIANWNPYDCTDMTDMFKNVDMNNPNSNINRDQYNGLLTVWGVYDYLQNNVIFNGVSSKYSYNGLVLRGRTNLINKNWTITDSGAYFEYPYFELQLMLVLVDFQMNLNYLYQIRIII